jgi:hypothetical protein
MSVMIVFTALQLMFRSSSGVAKAAAASAAMIERYAGAIEMNKGDADRNVSNGDACQRFIYLTTRP